MYQASQIAIALAITVAVSCNLQAAPIVSDFDDGTRQGWTEKLPFGGTLTNPGSGGNPGGFLFATDNVPGGGGLWAVAPSSFLGDLSGFAGLQWDELVYVRGAGGSRTVESTELFITGASSTTYRLADRSPTIIGDWHTRFIAFNPSSFILSSGSDSFDDVIRSVTELAIEMDTSTLANGGPESGIDNVQLVVPEPTSMTLFGLTALGFGVGFRHRRNNGEAIA